MDNQDPMSRKMTEEEESCSQAFLAIQGGDLERAVLATVSVLGCWSENLHRMILLADLRILSKIGSIPK